MKLTDCLECVHHRKKTKTGIVCSFYSDQILKRTLINSKDINFAVVLDCPLSKKITIH